MSAWIVALKHSAVPSVFDASRSDSLSRRAGRPIAYRAGTRGVSQHKAQLENVGSVVFWTGLKKGTVYVSKSGIFSFSFWSELHCVCGAVMF